MPFRLHMGPVTKHRKRILSNMTVYAKGRGDKVQESLDREFGKSPDSYGHWMTIEAAKRKHREGTCNSRQGS